jgi:hypothetical protein
MGKLKGKIVKSSDSGLLIDDKGNQYKYDQPYSKELGLQDNMPVSFNLVTVEGTQTAVSVCVCYSGTISTIDPSGTTGSIAEAITGVGYKFNQPYLNLLKYGVGDTVSFIVVDAPEGVMATCLDKK